MRSRAIPTASMVRKTTPAPSSPPTRCAEFLLALAINLGSAEGVHALACDTDGIDGSEDNAGALMTPDSYARAAALGLSSSAELDNNNGYGYFAALDALIVTGPTRTNVNDFRAILILESSEK